MPGPPDPAPARELRGARAPGAGGGVTGEAGRAGALPAEHSPPGAREPSAPPLAGLQVPLNSHILNGSLSARQPAHLAVISSLKR